MDSFSSDSPGFISSSLAETGPLDWNLLPFTKKEIERVLETLLRSEELVLERAEIGSQAITDVPRKPRRFSLIA